MHGIAEVTFRGGPDGTRLAGLYHRAPLRVLLPSPPEPGLATAVLVTTSGGLAGGDRLEARVEVQEAGAAQVSGQAAEKVYRSRGADCRVDVHLVAGPGSWLEWLPQETILFDGARLDRRTRVDRAPGSRVLAGEILVFGRAAYGERLRRGAVRDAWEIRCNGRLVWADALAMAGDLAALLAAPPCLAGAVAVATLVYVADNAGAALDLARDLTRGAAGGEMMVGCTCIAGVLVVRWLGRDARMVRNAFGRFWAAFRHRIGGLAASLPRVWGI